MQPYRVADELGGVASQQKAGLGTSSSEVIGDSYLTTPARPTRTPLNLTVPDAYIAIIHLLASHGMSRPPSVIYPPGCTRYPSS